MAEPHSTTAQGTRSQVPRFRSLLHRQQQREVTALGLPAASTAPSQGGLGELTQSGTQHHRAHRKGPCPGPPEPCVTVAATTLCLPHAPTPQGGTITIVPPHRLCREGPSWESHGRWVTGPCGTASPGAAWEPGAGPLCRTLHACLSPHNLSTILPYPGGWAAHPRAGGWGTGGVGHLP